MNLIASTASNVLIPFVYCLALVILAVVFLKLNDWIFHRRPSEEKIAASANRFEKRLTSPDFEGLEKHFAHSLSSDIKALYQNREEILKENFEVLGKDTSGAEKVWFVAFYQPADLENVRDAWPDTNQVFEFANDGCGNGYTIDPKLDNPPVMFYDHETGEWDEVSKSMSDFMAMPRRRPKG